MAGVKGRSGRPKDAAALRRRNESISRAQIRRVDDRDRKATTNPPEPPPLTAEQLAAAERAGAGKLPPPVSWREALQRMNAGVAALKREKLQIEIETLKRERIPAGEVRSALELQRSAILRELATLSGLADQIPEARPHQVEALRSALLAFAEQFRRTITEISL